MISKFEIEVPDTGDRRSVFDNAVHKVVGDYFEAQFPGVDGTISLKKLEPTSSSRRWIVTAQFTPN